jgi:hypothetical protein
MWARIARAASRPAGRALAARAEEDSVLPRGPGGALPRRHPMTAPASAGGSRRQSVAGQKGCSISARPSRKRLGRPRPGNTGAAPVRDADGIMTMPALEDCHGVRRDLRVASRGHFRLTYAGRPDRRSATCYTRYGTDRLTRPVCPVMM